MKRAVQVPAKGKILEAAQDGVRVPVAFMVVQLCVLVRGGVDFWELLGILVDVQPGAKGVVVERHVCRGSCCCF